MLSYKLSKRERMLILALAVMLVIIAWYKLVYEYTTTEINGIRSQIETTNAQIEAEEARVAQLKRMENVIAAHKANGDEPTVMPTYDNTKPLMSELYTILGAANKYSLSFDAIDSTSTEYVLRGIGISFSCDVYSEAETILDNIANGPYPCVINSVSFSNSRKSTGAQITDGDDIRSVFATRSTEPSSSVSMHVTFFERPSEEMLAAKAKADAQAQALAEAQAQAAS